MALLFELNRLRTLAGLLHLSEDRKSKFKHFFMKASLSFSDVKEQLQVEVNRQSDQDDLKLELIKSLPDSIKPGADEANGVVQSLSYLVKPGKAVAYRMSDRQWCVMVDRQDLG